MTIEIKVKQIEFVDIDSIHPWVENINEHPESQIDDLVKQYEFNGMSSPLEVEDGTNDIVAGCGRWLAAKKAGMKKVPVYFREYESYSHKYARMVADNGTARQSELNLSAIHANLENLHLDDISLLGIEDFNFEPNVDDVYTQKIEAPIYEPKNKKPDISVLCDLNKAEKLIAEIEKSSIPEKEKKFLKFAAYRHIVFSYEDIADYYAHSKKEMQELMEKSALVIIDFKKAIENGFAKLTDEVAESSRNG